MRVQEGNAAYRVNGEVKRWRTVVRTTRTSSSPITSTSGLLKCRSATIPARHAQSNIFPASARKCNVRRMCHTYHTQSQYFALSQRTRRTRCPARIHKDSLSTASLLLMTLSSILVIVTSSSDGLENPSQSTPLKT